MMDCRRSSKVTRVNISGPMAHTGVRSTPVHTIMMMKVCLDLKFGVVCVCPGQTGEDWLMLRFSLHRCGLH